MTLNEFLAHPHVSHAWVSFNDFNVYVRRGYHNLGTGVLFQTFDLANFDMAERLQGKGRFAKLIAHLCGVLDDKKFLYVENVQQQRFRDHLTRTGWATNDGMICGLGGTPSYFIRVDDAKARLLDARDGGGKPSGEGVQPAASAVPEE